MVFGIVIGALFLALFNYVLYKFLYHSWEEGRPLYYKNVDVDLAGKTVLITGANCGLGKATALDLATRGARVILACRNKEKAEAAAEEIKRESGNEDVSVIMLDLSDLDSVKAAADTVIEKHDRLDILINNAGIGLTDSKVTKQGFDLIFGTNYLGHYLFTQLLLDLLKKSAPSRIINVSSNAMYAVWQKLNYQSISEDGKVKFPKLQGYPISKLGNYYHIMTLADELKGTGVTANAVHPGYVKTEIAKRNIEDKPKAILNKVFFWLSNIFGRTAKEGCQTSVYVAVDQELAEVSGEYFSNLKQTTDKLTGLSKDKVEAEKLSKLSYEICQNYLPPRQFVNEDVSLKTDEEKKDADKDDPKGLFQPIVAEFETAKPEEIGAVSLSTGYEKLDESSVPLSEKNREASPVKEDVKESFPTTVVESSLPELEKNI